MQGWSCGVWVCPQGDSSANQTARGHEWFLQTPGVLLGCLPFRVPSTLGNIGEGSGVKTAGSDTGQEDRVLVKVPGLLR